MINTHPLQMIGRDEIVEQLMDRLQRPDDVRNVPKEFISPGFHGLAGIGKSRLIREVAGRAAQLTPYVVHVDLDPRAGGVVPGTRPWPWCAT